MGGDRGFCWKEQNDFDDDFDFGNAKYHKYRACSWKVRRQEGWVR
jgi:hypothetical protein